MEIKIIKNYIYNISYQVLLVIVPLITTPYVSRVLNADGVGIYSYTFTISTAFSLFAALGINSYGQREIAYLQDNINERSKVFWELFISRILTTLVVGALYICFSTIYGQYSHYLFLQSAIVFATMFDISWFYQGIENFRIIAIRNFFVKILTVVLIFSLVSQPSHLGRYILINSLSTLASYLLFFPNLRKVVVRIPFNQLSLNKHMRGMIEFFIPLIATQMYSQLDKLMLGIFASNIYESGYYEQARKIVSILVMVLISINTVMYPRISNLFVKNDKATIKSLYEESLRIIFMFLVPVVIGLWFVSDNFVMWFFGEGYTPVSILIKLSGFLLVFMALGNFVGMQYLSPTGKQNKMTLVYIQAAVINFILNLFLISRFQALGALIASIVAEAFSGMAQIVLLQKSEYRLSRIEGMWKYLIAGVVMGMGLGMLAIMNPFSGISQTLVEVLLGGVIYIVMLILMKERNVMAVTNKLKFYVLKK